MEFFNSAVDVLQTLVVALGAGLGIWGAINLLEGYGNDNPGAKSQGMKQLMAGGGVALVGLTLVPLLAGLFGSSTKILNPRPLPCHAGGDRKEDRPYGFSVDFHSGVAQRNLSQRYYEQLIRPVRFRQ